MRIRSKRTNYPIVQLAFDESVTEPSVTHYICTETPELNFEEYSKKIEDWCREEEDSRQRKIDDRQQAEDSKERSVPRAPSAVSENDPPWNYWRRGYLPMKDFDIDFQKYAKDLVKNAEASTNKGTGNGYKGNREGTKGEQEQKGGKKGREGEGKQEHPPKGALRKAAATAAPERQEAQAHKGNPKGNPKRREGTQQGHERKRKRQYMVHSPARMVPPGMVSPTGIPGTRNLVKNRPQPQSPPRGPRTRVTSGYDTYPQPQSPLRGPRTRVISGYNPTLS